MSGSRDSVTGDIALACGSDDGTISVWALPLTGATKRRLFGKVDIIVGTLPWQLLYGHGEKVTAIALQADLDVVVSASGNSMCLVHSMRMAQLLHSLYLPGSETRSNGSVVGIAISNDGLVAIHQHSEGMSYLYLFTINAGYLTSICTSIEDKESVIKEDSTGPGTAPEGSARPKLIEDIVFSSCSTYLLTATGGPQGGIDIRYARSLEVHRRVETRPFAPITTISLSPDERCIIAGMEDGTLVSYALHFGLGTTSDEAKAVRAAKAEEAAAVAAAAKRDLVAQSSQNTLDWMSDPGQNRSGRVCLPFRAITSYSPEWLDS